MRFLLYLVVIMGLSCSGQKKTTSEEGEVAVENFGAPNLVMQDSYSNLTDPIFQVISGEKALKQIFSRINMTRKPGIPIPEVDFNKETLLFYGAGITAGIRDLELYIKEESQDSIKIAVVDTLRSANAGAIITSPFCIYSVPKTQKEIVFIEGENEGVMREFEN